MSLLQLKITLGVFCLGLAIGAGLNIPAAGDGLVVPYSLRADVPPPLLPPLSPVKMARNAYAVSPFSVVDGRK